jgi:hypothetical protein
MNQANVSASHEIFDKVLSNPIEQYVKQSSLPARYGICNSTLTHRINKLKIKTLKTGRNGYLTLDQLEVLDELDAFLHDHPGAKIDDFLVAIEGHRNFDKVCNPFVEPSNNVIETSTEVDWEQYVSALKQALDETVNLLNQSLSLNQVIENERQLWINHAVNSDKTINEQRQSIAELETSYLMQLENIKRLVIEIDQLKNVLALLNKNSQSENVMNFLSPQHQQKTPPYNPKTMNHSS